MSNEKTTTPKEPLPFEISEAVPDVWKLHMNRTELLANKVSPYWEENCDVAVVGIVVFQPSSAIPKILLVKRAAHDSFPGKWEIPGGGVEYSDISIAHAVARELREEASLEIAKILTELKTNYFMTFKDVKQEDGSNLSQRKIWAQLVYAVEIKDETTFKTDPNEHSEGVWATQEEAAELPMLDGQKTILANAFKWIREPKEKPEPSA